jgi:GMP synthase-like glutamine amidotransferase
MADPFIPFLRTADSTTSFGVYKAHRDELPIRADECDAWLVTGSPKSVYHRDAWQGRLSAFLREATRHRPVIGICFGHQLLHDVLGGAVEKSTAGWATGVQSYELREIPSWAPRDESLPARAGLRLIALHEDQVVRPAKATRVIAGNDSCPLGITTIGDNVLTIQAHPEMTRSLARDLYKELRAQQGDALTERALESLTTTIDDGIAARWILGFVRDRLEGRR